LAVILPQQEIEIQRRVLNQDPFEDVVPVPEMNAPHAAGFQGVSEGPFQHQATLTEQAFAAFTVNAATVRVDGLLLFGPVLPFPPSAAS
jgi:hypothetical protein